MTGIIAATLDSTLYQRQALDDATIPISDRGLLLGEGLFETLPILNHHPIWLSEHLDRLEKAAKLVELPFDRKLAEDNIHTLAEFTPDGRGIIRLSLTGGSGGRGLLPPDAPTPCMIASLMGYPAAMAHDSLTLMTSSIRRNEYSPASRIKSLNYLDNILAAKEAAKQGIDDALMLNSKGFVACTTIGNIFTIIGNEVITPPISDGVLPGILRQKLIDHASEIGLSIKEHSLTIEDIKKADGLFLTNSLRLIRTVTHLDGHSFDHDRFTPILRQYQTLIDHLIAKECNRRA